jgi:hypothetical protein
VFRKGARDSLPVSDEIVFSRTDDVTPLDRWPTQPITGIVSQILIFSYMEKGLTPQFSTPSKRYQAYIPLQQVL